MSEPTISGDLAEKVAAAEYEHDEGSTPGGWYKPWADVDKNTHWDYVRRARAGLKVAVPLIRAQVAAEIARDVERQTGGSDPANHAYEHAAWIARMHAARDCGHEYHGADGGPCPSCGFDIAALPAAGSDVIDMGFLSLPAEIQAEAIPTPITTPKETP